MVPEAEEQEGEHGGFDVGMAVGLQKSLKFA
jgi:hypothetical protein